MPIAKGAKLVKDGSKLMYWNPYDQEWHEYLLFIKLWLKRELTQNHGAPIDLKKITKLLPVSNLLVTNLSVVDQNLDSFVKN